MLNEFLDHWKKKLSLSNDRVHRKKEISTGKKSAKCKENEMKRAKRKFANKRTKMIL